MTREQYEKISSPFRRNEKAVRALNTVNIILTTIVYIAYPSLIIFLFATRNEKLLRCVLVPGTAFVLVSLLREIINRQRPYEKLGFSPLIKKEKRGRSMPSRHVFSVFVIGMAFMFVMPVLSVPFFIIGVLLAAIRVVGGVHYLSDVVVGAAIGVLAGAIGFYL